MGTGALARQRRLCRLVVHRPRALRFRLQMNLRYRSLEAPDWHPAHTENISYSGVLFHGEEHLPVNTPIEMRLLLSGAQPTGAADILCHGHIVRAVPATADAPAALAATILDYRFMPERARAVRVGAGHTLPGD